MKVNRLHIIVAMGIVLLAVGPASAGASHQTDDAYEESKSDAQSSQEGRNAIIPQSEIGSYKTTGGVISAKKSNFLAKMARMGNLYASEDVVEYVVPSLNGSSTIISPSGYIPDMIGEESKPSSSSGYKYHALGIQMVAEENVRGSVAATGLAFSPGLTTNADLKIVSKNCSTAYFTPEYVSKQNHRLTTCYEKWRESNTNNWIYNRWAWFSRAKPTSFGRYAAVLDFTIRSMPWNGYERRIARMTNHTPAAPQGGCTTTATFSLSVGAVSLSIPIHRCSTTQIVEDFNKHRGGIDWDGKTQNQLYLDFGMAVESNGNTPIFADYAWMEICDSLTSYTCPFNPSQYLILKDSGWVWN